MMKKKQKFSRSPLKLILIFIFITVFILIIGIRYYYVQKEEIKNEAYKDLSVISGLKVNQIINWRNEKLNHANVIYSRSLLVSKLKNWFENPKDIILKSEIISYFSVYYNVYHYKDIILIDTNGLIKYSLDLNHNKLCEVTFNKFTKTAEQRKPVFSDFYYCPSCNEIHLDIIIPLFEKNALFGGIILRINVNEYLFPLIQTWPTSSPTSETLLFERDGDEVVYLNELRHRKNNALKLRIKIDSSNYNIPAVQAVLGKTGLTEGNDYRGIPVLADIRKITDSQWYMIAKVDLDEIYRPVQEKAFNTSILIGLLLISFAIGFIWVWTNQKKSLKIHQLEEERKHQALIKHFEYVVKYANDIYLLADKNFNIVEINQRALQVYGYSREEFIGLNIKDLRAPETLAELEKRLEFLKNSPESFYETIHKRKDGSIFPVEASIRHVEIDGEKFLQGIIRDISERKKSEELLRESEIKFRSLFENTILGIYRTTPDGKIIDCNPALLKMLGYDSLEDITNRNLELDGFEPGYSRTEFRKKIETEGKIIGLESAWQKKDGTYIYVNENSKAVKDEDGKFLFYEGTVEDITEKKRYQSEQYKLLNIIDKSLNEIYVFDSETFKFEYANYGALKNIGYTIEELREMTPVDIKPEISFDRFREMVKPLKTGEKDIIIFETTHRRKDGTDYFVEVHLQIYRQSDKNIFYAVINDVTKRKEQEKQILKEKEWSEGIISLAPNIVVALGKKSKILLFNKFAERLTGYKAEEVLGKKWIEIFIPEKNRKELYEVWDEIVGNKLIAHQYENPVITKDGEVRIIRWNNTIITENGEFRMILSVGEDITERKKAEEELNRNKELLDEMGKIASIGGWEFNPVTFKGTWTEQVALIHDMDPNDETNAEKGMSFYIGESKIKIENAIKEAIEKGTPYDLELEMITAKGNHKWVRTIGLADKSGDKVIRIHGSFQDITEFKKAEAALQESEERLRLSLKAARQGLYDLNIQTGEAIVNDEYVLMLGYDPKTFKETNQFWIERLHPEDKDLSAKSYQNYINGISKEFSVEFRQKTKSGEWKWILSTGSIVEYDKNKNPLRMLGTHTDISERKKAEQELLESEDKFRTLFEHMSEGVALHELIFNEHGETVDYKIIDVNPAYEIHTGVSVENIRNKLATEFYGTTKAPYLDIYIRTALTGQPASFETYFAPLKKYFEISVFSPKKNFFATVFTDITVRKKNEEEIKKLNEELEQKVLERTKELEDKNIELVRMNKLFVGRELRMAELKQKIKELEEKIK